MEAEHKTRRAAAIILFLAFLMATFALVGVRGWHEDSFLISRPVIGLFFFIIAFPCFVFYQSEKNPRWARITAWLVVLPFLGIVHMNLCLAAWSTGHGIAQVLVVGLGIVSASSFVLGTMPRG